MKAHNISTANFGIRRALGLIYIRSQFLTAGQYRDPGPRSIYNRPVSVPRSPHNGRNLGPDIWYVTLPFGCFRKTTSPPRARLRTQSAWRQPGGACAHKELTSARGWYNSNGFGLTFLLWDVGAVGGSGWTNDSWQGMNRWSFVRHLDTENNGDIGEEAKNIATTTPTLIQYKLSCTISNNTEVYEEPVPRAKKMPHCAVNFEAGEENRIVYKSLYWVDPVRLSLRTSFLSRVWVRIRVDLITRTGRGGSRISVGGALQQES